MIDDRPFVVADGLSLPFKDKSFDYAITSHILEHVDDPHRFIGELMRVARAGYIETPSELGESIFGWPFHRWIVRIESDTIIIRHRKQESLFGNYFHQQHAGDLNFAEFIDSHFSDFYVQHEWVGSIKIRIDDDESPAVRFNTNTQLITAQSTSKTLARKLIYPLSSVVLKILRHFRKFE